VHSRLRGISSTTRQPGTGAPNRARIGVSVASDREFVTFVCEQLRGAGAISSRRMFGEAAVYFEDKVVGLVCDNQLFLKATEPGRAMIGVPTEAPPFPGASNWFLMADLDDPEFLADLIRTTAAALPEPKLKTKKTRRAKAKPRAKKAGARAK
jgi:DNA transformation protein and related proteins